jgi:hypothetical protein
MFFSVVIFELFLSVCLLSSFPLLQLNKNNNNRILMVSALPQSNLIFDYRFASSDVVGGKVANYANGTRVYDATLMNGASCVDGVGWTSSRSALTLNSSQYLQLPPFTSPSSSNGMTFAIWAKSNLCPAGSTYLNFGNGAPRNTDNIVFYFETDTTLTVYLRAGTTDYYLIISTTGCNHNAWCFLVLTISSSGDYKLFINSNSPLTAHAIFPPSLLRTVNVLGGSCTQLIGKFQLYNKELTSIQVENLYNIDQIEYPTGQPSCQPSLQPSRQPTCSPSSQPTSPPSRQPFSYPSTQPSRVPSAQPSNEPTQQPTSLPSSQPTMQPTNQPTSIPTKSLRTLDDFISNCYDDVCSIQGGIACWSNQGSADHCCPSSTSGCWNQAAFGNYYCPHSTVNCVVSCNVNFISCRNMCSYPSRCVYNGGAGYISPGLQCGGAGPGQGTFSCVSLPSSQPSSNPSSQPTGQPSRQPISQPTSQPTSRPSKQTIFKFQCTGAVQTFTIPSWCNQIYVDMAGAEGGYGGGFGGRVKTFLFVPSGSLLYVFVGQFGSYLSGGSFGGGGPHGAGGSYGTGGGASDIRIGGQSLYNRTIVAGGGGGAGTGGGGYGGEFGGAAGASTKDGQGGTNVAGGAPGVDSCSSSTNPTAGSFGQGGSGGYASGAGGGGYYGGIFFF